MNGMQLIEAERARQQAPRDEGGEGITAAHDAQHWERELLAAAEGYLGAVDASAPQPSGWPWAPEWWKPRDRVRNLVRGGALLLAAADRRRARAEGSEREQALRDRAAAVAAQIDALED